MIPAHLTKYIVDQDYSRYTPEDQAVWRYIMRQLKTFLAVYAHPCYLDGLEKTGIETDRIPNISEMSGKLQKFGWQAIPVSGFIPPAAFMELQSYGYLPIASDMRSLDHLGYTPAPDIVHEAAGHAPILVDPAFAGYLKQYAKVASHAIISSQDMAQYEAIRVLSDIKENPDSTPSEITNAEHHLKHVTENINHISEAARLGRMNWWTAEYGLIGSLENPKIFGAGLLSSLSEARACLLPQVRKIPLTVDCVEYAYDITEQQPQLFVTPDFETLSSVLDDLAKTMAYRTGGLSGLNKALKAKTVNTAELNSGLQISGIISRLHTHSDQQSSEQIAYLQTTGPTQLSLARAEILGHDAQYHSQGFGSPVGLLDKHTKCLSEFSANELETLGLKVGHKSKLLYASGVTVEGVLLKELRAKSGKLVLLSFSDCRVTRGDELLFDPAWGTFDMAIGSSVVSVFSGPADREAYGETADFTPRFIPRKSFSSAQQQRFQFFSQIRELRESLPSGTKIVVTPAQLNTLKMLVAASKSSMHSNWLAELELLELSAVMKDHESETQLRAHLQSRIEKVPETSGYIHDGLKLIELKPDRLR